jgi:lysophospholipase L1-like esterase
LPFGANRSQRQGAVVEVVAALCLGLLGCTREPAGALHYLALGDSYTVGEGVSRRARWPVQLAARLRERGVVVADPQIIAQTGWTTANLAAALEAAQPHGPFALVSIQIGVNNQFQGRDIEEYRRELDALLQRALAFGEGDASRVLVLSIPDWGVTPFAAGRDHERIAAELDRFNQVCREEAERAGVRYVDVTPESRHAAADRTLLAGDGLHPSAKMYASWVDLSLPAALAALRAATPEAPARVHETSGG